MADSHSERRRAQRAARSAARPQAAPVEERRRSNFFAESWAELRKVEWPSQQQVISGTAVVIIASLITGVYLYANDELWSYVVKHVFLR